MYTFPPKVHSGPILIPFLLHSLSHCLLLKMRQLYSPIFLYLEIANSNFPLFFRLLSRNFSSVLLILFSDIFSGREKLDNDMLYSNFRKIPFHPKIMSFALIKVKLPTMTGWHIDVFMALLGVILFNIMTGRTVNEHSAPSTCS